MSDEDGGERPLLPDLGSLLSQFEQAGERLESAAAAAARTIVEGRAGDGAVTVQMSGDFDPLSVRIDPTVVAEGDVSMLEDLVLAALRDALAQAAELQAGVAEAAAAPNLDLSSLGGLLGGLAAGGEGATSGVLGNLSEVLGGLGLGAPDWPLSGRPGDATDEDGDVTADRPSPPEGG